MSRTSSPCGKQSSLQCFAYPTEVIVVVSPPPWKPSQPNSSSERPNNKAIRSKNNRRLSRYHPPPTRPLPSTLCAIHPPPISSYPPRSTSNQLLRTWLVYQPKQRSHLQSQQRAKIQIKVTSDLILRYQKSIGLNFFYIYHVLETTSDDSNDENASNESTNSNSSPELSGDSSIVNFVEKPATKTTTIIAKNFQKNEDKKSEIPLIACGSPSHAEQSEQETTESSKTNNKGIQALTQSSYTSYFSNLKKTNYDDRKSPKLIWKSDPKNLIRNSANFLVQVSCFLSF